MVEHPAPEQPANGEPLPPPPWTDPEIQHAVRWRDGDIVISVPIKSGTTWTMNIVHQLREGGDPHFEDVYVEVPWLELVPSPRVTREERLARIDALPRHRRRAFKTHSAPGPLPYQAPGTGAHVQYVVVMRNPEEAVASMHPFIASHSDAWFDLWQTPREVFVRDDFATFFADVGRQFVAGMLFGFAAAWWPLRHQPNVLLMHFADMKRDHEGSVRRIAEFLGFSPLPGQWPTVLECTSFRWMKAHEGKFEGRAAAEIPVLEPGAMVRKGKAGAAAEDGVTPLISAEIERIGRGVVADDAAFEWLYRGGPLPR
jgi:aryl sulfotransferase